MGWRVKRVSLRTLRDYSGMNAYAAKALGFDHKLRRNEILVDATLPPKTQKKVIRHEIVEAKLMRKGLSYWEAHKIALKG